MVDRRFFVDSCEELVHRRHSVNVCSAALEAPEPRRKDFWALSPGCTRRRSPGERREKRWGAILLGILMIVSIGYVQPSVRGDWFDWAANIARMVGGVWLLAWGAKGARVV